MKKFIILALLSLSIVGEAWAQPSFFFSNATACQGDTFTVNVTVSNFSNITSAQFRVDWDAAVIQYVGAQNPGLPGFNVATNIDANNSAEGNIDINWSVAACNAPGSIGVTLNDCFGTCRPTILQLRFVMLSNTYGETSNVGTGPNPYLTKDNSSCLNVGLINHPALISNCVRPVELIASQRQGNTGDLVCIDFRVTGFDDLNSMQFSVNYDPTVLNFENVVIPGALPNFTQAASLGLPPNVPEGNITVSWLYITPENTGITIADSTIIFQACFRIVGPCESASMISFGNNPTPIEIGNTIVQNFNILVLRRSGRVQVSNCAPTGMAMAVNCGQPRNLGETFCVDVTATNFFNVAKFNYLVEWNPSILQFQGVNNVTSNGIANFNAVNNFSTANVQGGILGVNWERTGFNNAFIPNGEVHYRICFEVIGVGGNSPIQITGPLPEVRINSPAAPNIGINPSNCEVVINQPTGVTLRLQDGEATLNNQLCVDITTANFTNITRLRYSLNWDPLHLQFVSIQNLSLPGVVPLINFGQQGASSGVITFEWNTATPVTRPDGTALFRICFAVIGTPGNCDEVMINDDPLSREAVTSFSNGNNIGIVSQNGSICSLFPEGFFMTIGNNQTFWRDTTCVPFRVSSFDNITEAHFDVSYNPVHLEYAGVRNLAPLAGLTAGSFNASQAALGVIQFDWVNFAGGLLADSTVLFEMCFVAIGDADGACFPIEVIREPAPGVLTTAGVGSLVWRNGRVCVSDKLYVLNAVITPVSCPGANDGTIEITVEGGLPPYGTTWESSPLQFMPLSARNLPPGPIVVTIWDNRIPATIRLDTFFIPLANDIPVASAGPDRVFPCDGSTLIGVQGTGTTGTGFSTQWTTLGGELANPTNTPVGLALRQGIYIFSVTNNETGCTVRDTMNVLSPIFPVANAGDNLATTCLSDTLTLNGSLSSTGDTVSYLWTSPSGGVIALGTQNTLNPVVIGEGTYVLEVRFNNTACVSRDTMLVLNGEVLPAVNAGSDPTLGCDESILLDASASTGAHDLSFRWENINGVLLSDSATYLTSSPGQYVIVVTDIVNGCSAADTLTVSPAGVFPEISTGTGYQLTCNDDEITITASVSNSTNFAVQWIPLDGGQVDPATATLLSPSITAPGNYQITVRDLFTQCVATAIVNVGDQTTPPLLVLQDADTLNCTATQITLQAQIASGPDIVSRWTSNGTTLLNNSPTLTVGSTGIYTLTVSNQLTGCVSTDSTEVFEDVNRPQIGITPPPVYTCLFDTIPLFSNVIFGEVPGMIYQWNASAGNQFIIGDQLANPVITAPGTFSVSVQNPNNGCIGSASVTIVADTLAPVITAGPDRFIGCTGESVRLNGSVISAANNFVVQWFSPDMNLISNTDTVTVADFGLYTYRVTDVGNGCISSDISSVSPSTDVPEIILPSDTLVINCSADRISIPAQINFGGNFSFSWASADGALVAGTENNLAPQTETAGTYVLTAINLDNQCSSSDSVVVIIDRSLPTAIAGPDVVLNCITTAHTLSSAGSSTGPTFTGNWFLNNLNTPVSNLTVTQPGTYLLRVVNTGNSCFSIDTTIITLDGTSPSVAVLGNNLERLITCTSPTVSANINYTPANPAFSVVWTASPGAGFVSIAADSLSITVNRPGVYTVAVTNPNNGCIGTNEVVVDIDTIRPNAIITSPTTVINCITSVISLNGNGSSVGPEFSASWNALSGGPLSSITPLQVTTGTAGAYELVISNSVNGCIGRDTIVITENLSRPTASIIDPQVITCTLPQVLLNGQGSSSGGGFTTVWNGLDGGIPGSTPNPLQVTVNSGGRYELVILNTANGCESRDTVTVIQNTTQPNADAGAGQNINCNGITVTLNGSGSTPAGNLSYLWSAISQGGPITNANAANATVNTAGTYRLIVTDNTNGCRDTATTTVSVVRTLPDAMAGENALLCGNQVLLSAMLPSGLSGRWQALTSGTVVSPNTPDTEVTGAQPGPNRFVWFLSSAQCADYSADTVTINVQRAPIAGSDLISIASGSFAGSVNVLANDQLFGAQNVTPVLTQGPAFGQVDSFVNNILYFSVAPGVFGTTQIRYQICNPECPDLCATGTVQLDVERTIVQYDVPNAITPNGDGLNEELIFDQLVFNPDLYPNNELIIFNRWNDIVFKASPYLNNWRGTNQQGQELPQGTYYYLLRLNIAEGEVLKGDITVVR